MFTVEPSTLIALAPVATVLITGVFALLLRAADRIEALNRRAADKAERERIAQEVETRVERRSQELANSVRLQLELKQTKDDLARLRTLNKIEEVHSTAKEAALGAERAYQEANHVNLKIADVQGSLKAVVDQLPAAIAAVALPPAPALVVRQEVTSAPTLPESGG